MVHPEYRTGQTDQQLADEVKKVMDDATKQGYDQVKENAQADYKNIYDRVKIDFGQEASDKTIDELIKAYKDGNASTEEKSLFGDNDFPVWTLSADFFFKRRG